MDPLAQLNSALADRYHIEREIGRGGMAAVYLARDVRHDRQVAVKVLYPDLAAALGIDRFLAEIRTTANLQHPHILPLFDSGQADGQLFYVMPFVVGETLRARLEREKQLPVADAIRIATETADALQYAHERGLIHRDIKPENILLQQGHAMVADFGIALAVAQASGQRLTQTGLSLGTPQYMSPEQAMGERNIDARTDIYALGAVTYEMLAGEPPFTGPTAQAVIAQVITGEARLLTERRRSVPAHVSAAVQKALEKIPADRFASAREFSTALTTPGDHAALLPRGPMHWRRHRASLGLVVVALAALVAAIWGWTRGAVATSRTDARTWLATLSFPDSALPVRTFALSPDGSRFVYTAQKGQSTQIWVRDADELDPRPLLGTDSASYPVVSPDGRRIAFLAGHSLRTVGVTGGPLTKVTDTLSTFSVIEWSDDDHILVAHRGGIVAVPVTGGAWKRLTTIDTAASEVFHTGASPLPGGQSILFVAIPRNYGDNSRFQIAVSDPTTGRHRTLIPGFWARYLEPGYLLVVRPDSTLIAVPFDAAARRITGPPIPLAAGTTVDENAFPQIAAARTGQLVFASGGSVRSRSSLARVHRDGAPTLLDSTWVAYAREVAVSPDGSHAAASVDLGTWNIQVRDLRSGASTNIAMQGTVAGDPVFASDGRSAFFVTNNGQTGEIYRVATSDASAPRTLVVRDTALSLAEPSPSPDGRTLYYVRARGGRSDIMKHSLDQPSSADRPAIDAPARERSPSVSPNGRWLAYASDESGHFEIYVRSTDSSRADRWQISAGGGAIPRWSSDGRELFFIAHDSLLSAEATTDREFTVRSRHALFSLARFIVGRGGYDVLPGGAGFLMLERRESRSPTPRIVFVDQWKGLLAASRR